MTASDKPPLPSRVRREVQMLVETLNREHAALADLARHMEYQLDALCDQQEVAFDTHQQKASDALSALEDLAPSRKRHVQSLAAMLSIAPQAADVEALAKTLEHYPEYEETSRTLAALQQTVSHRTSMVQAQCNVVDSFLREAVTLRANVEDDLVEAPSAAPAS